MSEVNMLDMLGAFNLTPQNYDEVKRSDEGYTITVELPGISLDQVEVSICGPKLNIRIEEVEGSRFSGITKSYDVNFKPADIDARMKDGLLTVVVPFSKKKEQKIKVKSG